MTTEKKPRHRITRFHHTDLYCAALNNPDYSVMFMYPHEIKPIDFKKSS